MSIISEKDRADILALAMDPKKVTLTCGIHHYAYGGKMKPNFKCKRCMFTTFMGLIVNTPPDKQQEQLEMLEYSVHELIEAEKKGLLKDLLKHPEVYVNDERIGVPKEAN